MLVINLTAAGKKDLSFSHSGWGSVSLKELLLASFHRNAAFKTRERHRSITLLKTSAHIYVRSHRDTDIRRVNIPAPPWIHKMVSMDTAAGGECHEYNFDLLWANKDLCAFGFSCLSVLLRSHSSCPLENSSKHNHHANLSWSETWRRREREEE